MVRLLTELLRLFTDKPVAVAMLTHNDEPRILRHFQRLKDEAGIPVYRVRHVPDGTVAMHSYGNDTIPIDSEAIERTMPRRLNEMKRCKRSFATGYVDAVIMTAALSPALRRFRDIWFVEYDVDFAGRWSEVFARYRDDRHDMIGFRLNGEAESLAWSHWSWFKSPIGARRYNSFVPIMRLSRSFIDQYVRASNSGDWEGHIEAMLPSIALASRASILDMGSGSEFSAQTEEPLLNNKTFGFRPPRASSYFHEDAAPFSKGLLHHPIKIA